MRTHDVRELQEVRPKAADELLRHGSSSASLTREVRREVDRMAVLVRLKRAREARHLTQRHVAHAMGTSQSKISELESGQTDPRLGTLQRYARHMGLDLKWVVREGAASTSHRPGARDLRHESTNGGPYSVPSSVEVASGAAQALLDNAESDGERKAEVVEARRKLQLVVELKAIRERLELTQTELATLMGVSQSTVSDFESGNVDPQLETLLRYSSALNVEVKWHLNKRKPIATAAEITDALMGSAPDTVLSPLLTALTRENEEQSRTIESLVSALAPLPGNWTTRLLSGLEHGGWATSSNDARGKIYTLKDAVASLIGLSVHRDRIVGVVTNLAGDVLISETSRFEVATREVVLDTATQLASRLVRQAPSGVLGIGVSVAGVVEAQSGTVMLGTSLVNPEDSWDNVSLEQDLQAAARRHISPELRVAVENDANCLVVSEYLRRGDTSAAAFLFSGLGVGAGMILAGHLAHGAHNVAGEIGHRIVVKDGPRCRLGLEHNGCLETVVSAEGILGELGIETHDSLTLKAGLKLANERIASADSAAAAAFKRAGYLFGQVLSASILLLDPDRIALYAHSEFADSMHFESAKCFQRGVAESLEQTATERYDFAELPRLEWHTLQETSRARAAALAAFWHFLRRPTHWARSLLEPVILAR